VGIEVRGCKVDGVPVGSLGAEQIALGFSHIAEIVVGVQEIGLVLDCCLQQRHGGGGIAGLEAGDGAEVQRPRIVWMLRQQQLTAGVAALQKSRNPAESGIDIASVRPGSIALASRCFQAFPVLAIHGAGRKTRCGSSAYDREAALGIDFP